MHTRWNCHCIGRHIYPSRSLFSILSFPLPAQTNQTCLREKKRARAAHVYVYLTAYKQNRLSSYVNKSVE